MRILLVPIILFSFAEQAQNTGSSFIRRIAHEMVVNGKAYENLGHLTNQIEGCLDPSLLMVKAEKWRLVRLKQPRANTAYLQECVLPRWIMGGDDKANVASVDDNRQKTALDVLPLGNRLATGIDGVTTKVIAFSYFHDLEKRKDEVSFGILTKTIVL